MGLNLLNFASRATDDQYYNLRAEIYFDLVKNFGGVPLIEGLKMPDEIKGIERASVADTYAFIEKDLLEAIPDLPVRSQER